MTGAERLAGVQDFIDGGGDLTAVVRVFMCQYQFGGRGDGAGLIAVDPLYLFGPFPPLVVEVEPEPAHSLGCSAGQGLFESADWPLRSQFIAKLASPCQMTAPIDHVTRALSVTEPGVGSMTQALLLNAEDS